MFFTRVLTTFLISLSVSVDDMVVGVAYGLRKIIIPFKAMFFILLGSTLSMAVSMVLGKYAVSYFNPAVSKYLSAVLLAGLGARVIIKERNEIRENPYMVEKNSYFKVSGKFKNWESFYLGLALGVDDFAEALGLAIAGFPIALTVFLFKLSEVIAILGGMYLGLKGLSKLVNEKMAYIPGITLILVGIYQIF